ncbi:NmrA/HSCARG family protein [Aspergillus aculeatinus CBS 121060]|uniref:NAD(P)-binding protein n=1 Tax=Aspergillus aculeatinus CBS 121060 TaxID=1448322 RepID=A0ACD1GY71_9EURO|nr:NAD(P)-binding protein [Aspergillus aculeatinus CBS 121060]RAH66092.1 NAD(P)-binding protein [Aspergillus aculeatinus CBS 121060]
MCKKLISVVGATGIQGGSVIDALLDDGTYKIRALTRNPASVAAKELARKGVEIIAADVTDISSLVTAFEGSSAIYAMTNFGEAYFTTGSPEQAIDVEAQQGINLAKAAAATKTLEHYIWSTLPNSKAVSGGKITVPQFEGKNKVEEFIRSDPSLLKKTTFFILGFYLENFSYPTFAPFEIPGAAQYVQLLCTPGDTRLLCLGFARRNIGRFVKAILEQPEKTVHGKYVSAFTEETTPEQMLKSWAKVKGKTAHYVEVGKPTFTELWTQMGNDMIAKMLDFHRSMEKNPWAGSENVLNKDDLGVTGLLDVEQSFAALNGQV